jgi:hypothetical protein
LGKVRVWDPLGGSAFKYDARTKGGVVNLLEALEFDLFSVRGSCCLVITFEGLSVGPPPRGTSGGGPTNSENVPFVRYLVIVGLYLAKPKINLIKRRRLCKHGAMPEAFHCQCALPKQAAHFHQH